MVAGQDLIVVMDVRFALLPFVWFDVMTSPAIKSALLFVRTSSENLYSCGG
jgi:hypothetical protein